MPFIKSWAFIAKNEAKLFIVWFDLHISQFFFFRVNKKKLSPQLFHMFREKNIQKMYDFLSKIIEEIEWINFLVSINFHMISVRSELIDPNSTRKRWEYSFIPYAEMSSTIMTYQFQCILVELDILQIDGSTLFKSQYLYA